MNEITDTKKLCCRCKQMKSVNEFGPDKTKSSGLRSSCLPCYNKYQREYRKMKRASLRSYKRLYWQTNKHKWESNTKEYQKHHHLVSKYGIGLDEFNQMMINQNHQCAICEKKFVMDSTNGPCVDHCHESGKIRGLLCRNCNRAMGLLKDSKITLTKAIEYLQRHI